MAITMRGILLTAVPTLAALFGIFWFRKKKKSLPRPEESKVETRADSVPRVILTQPSNEGLKVSELNISDPQLGEIPETDEVGSRAASHSNGDNEAAETAERQGDMPEPVIEDIIKVESVGSATCSQSSLDKSGENQKVYTNSEAKQNVNAGGQDSPLNFVQDGTNLASTDHVEETLEQSSIPTLSKTLTTRQVSAKDKGAESLPTKSENNEDSKKSSETVSNNNKERQEIPEKSHKKAGEQQDKETEEMCRVNAEMAGVVLNKSDRNRKSSDSISWDEESPSPELAASPVGNCSASTNGSETSGDSGIVATHPSKSFYQFNLPADLCGLLIGARGKNIRRVMDQSGAMIIVKDKVYDRAHQLIAIEGSKNCVAKALEIIKSKFPKKKFPLIDWSMAAPENPVLCSEIMQLHLPDGVHVDVIVSSVVSLNHVFVQQPTHPTFPMLENQNTTMNLCYSQDGVVPQLPRPIEMGVICAAPMYNGWYRAQVVQSYPEVDEVDLRFVDYGGYCREPGSALRQIRSDFTTLPFEAVECYLANVIPPKGAESFPAEANAVLEQLVQGQVLQAEVVGQEDDGVPYIQLYILKNNRMYLVNRELVDRGVASWVESA